MLPWKAMYRAALARGVAADGFWRLSLKEWRWLVSANTTPALDKVAFETLLKQYPDNPIAEDNTDGAV